MDEAGYGPNLGPLLITVTRWQTPDDPRQCAFYKLLKRAVDPRGHRDGERLHLADSKLVLTGKDGFASLETTALALLTVLGKDIASFHSVWDAVLHHSPDGGQAIRSRMQAWYHENLPLPVIADPVRVQRLADQLHTEMHKANVVLEEIRSDLVCEERFNALTTTADSKGLALSRLSFALLRGVWDSNAQKPTLCVGDKHGGRNRYDELLAEVLDGEMIFRIEESRPVSRYRVGATELVFQARGEEHLPVAAASIISKYLRELAMDQLNRFWQRYVPEVKPTRGYPGDAGRFRDAVHPARTQLRIADPLFWRAR